MSPRVMLATSQIKEKKNLLQRINTQVKSKVAALKARQAFKENQLQERIKAARAQPGAKPGPYAQRREQVLAQRQAMKDMRGRHNAQNAKLGGEAFALQTQRSQDLDRYVAKRGAEGGRSQDRSGPVDRAPARGGAVDNRRAERFDAARAGEYQRAETTRRGAPVESRGSEKNSTQQDKNNGGRDHSLKRT